MRKKVEETRARRRPRRSFTPTFKAEVVALVRQGERTLPTICREMDLSETAVRRWVEQAAVDAGEQDGLTAQRARAEAELTARIRAIHAASGGQYGVPRVLAELRAQGHDVGRKRVARLMTAAGLRGRRPPRWVRTTTPEPTPPAIPD